jgi:hypothetical protein
MQNVDEFSLLPRQTDLYMGEVLAGDGGAD